MIVPCLRCAALIFFRAGQLFEAAMKFLYLPAYLHRIIDHFPAQMRKQAVGYHPFNAAVRGNQLEELQRKRHMLYPYLHAPTPAAGRWLERVEDLVTRFLACT